MTGLFLYSLKTLENQIFPDASRRYVKWPMSYLKEIPFTVNIVAIMLIWFLYFNMCINSASNSLQKILPFSKSTDPFFYVLSSLPVTIL